MAISEGENSLVAASAIIGSNRELYCRLYIENTSDSLRTDFIVRDIKAMTTDIRGDSVECFVYTSDEYINEKEFQAALATVLATAVDMSNTSSTTTTTTYGSRGSMTTVTTVDDPSQKREIARQHAQELAMAQSHFEQMRAVMLKDETLFPGDSIEGPVVCEYRHYNQGPIKLIVPVGQDRHVFIFNKEVLKRKRPKRYDIGVR